MGDDYSVFGQLSQLNPSGSARNSKEVPVDKESRRRSRKPPSPSKAEPGKEAAPLEEGEDAPEEKAPVGKVVDITV